jgi:CheY-like chemotaxis protein
MKCLKILLVEDEDLIRLLVSEAMFEIGVTPIMAASGEEATKLIRSMERIDLLITDIQLTGALDGLDIARSARAHTPDLPIIFTTGQPDRMASWIPGPGDVFVPKPYRPSDIIAAIRRITAP